MKRATLLLSAIIVIMTILIAIPLILFLLKTSDTLQLWKCVTAQQSARIVETEPIRVSNNNNNNSNNNPSNAANNGDKKGPKPAPYRIQLGHFVKTLKVIIIITSIISIIFFSRFFHYSVKNNKAQQK